MTITKQGIATALLNAHLRRVKKWLASRHVVDRVGCVKELKQFMTRNPKVNTLFLNSNYTMETLLKALNE